MVAWRVSSDIRHAELAALHLVESAPHVHVVKDSTKADSRARHPKHREARVRKGARIGQSMHGRGSGTAMSAKATFAKKEIL